MEVARLVEDGQDDRDVDRGGGVHRDSGRLSLPAYLAAGEVGVRSAPLMARQEAPTRLEIVGLVGAATATSVCLASLLLAWAGAHDGVTALVIGLAVGVAVTAVILRGRRDWSIAPWSWTDAGLLALVLVVAAVLFFPGFPYAAKNRDPGVYVNHAVAIADQGSTTLDDPVADTGAELRYVGGEARIVTREGDVAWRKLPYRAFPTDPDQLDQLLPDFFHLWPAIAGHREGPGRSAGPVQPDPRLRPGRAGACSGWRCGGRSGRSRRPSPAGCWR